LPLSFSRTNTEKMTKPNYQYGKIYKIVNNVDDMIYIGSTCSRLSKRLHGHKIDKSGKGWKRRLYQHVDALGGWDHFRIILVQHCPCMGKDDLRMAEQRHIDATPPEKLLNMVRAYASVEDVIQRKAEEYQRKRHTDKYKEHAKAYQRAHKEQYDGYKLKYYETNKERISENNRAKFQWTSSWGGDMCMRWGENNLLRIDPNVFRFTYS
jgi:hypothetical protein